MLGHNTEFYWMGTPQNQSIFWTRLSSSPKYRLVLQWTNPNEFSIVYKYVKWTLFHNYVLTLRQYISEQNLFRTYLKQFVTTFICIKHEGDYCSVQISIFGTLTPFWKIQILDSGLILKNLYWTLQGTIQVQIFNTHVVVLKWFHWMLHFMCEIDVFIALLIPQLVCLPIWLSVSISVP